MTSQLLRHISNALFALAMAAAASLAQAFPSALPAPDLSTLDFRSSGNPVAANALSVIGLGPTGSAYVAGPFDSVNGQSRPHGLVRVKIDGTVDAAWAPTLPVTKPPKGAVESAAGAVAVVSDLETSEYRLILVPPSGAGAATIFAGTSPHAVVFDDTGSLFAALPSSLSVTVRKYTPTGVQDPAFELFLNGVYSPCFFPYVNASRVHSIARIGAHLYVVGNFTGQLNSRTSAAIRGAVRVSAASGDPDALWTPLSGSPYLSAGASQEEKLTCFPSEYGAHSIVDGPNDTVYMAGQFRLQERSYLARFSKAGAGAMDATWNPVGLQAWPGRMTADPAGQYLFFDGRGNAVFGQKAAAALSVATGLVSPWDPGDPGDGVTLIRPLSDRVLLGGTFTTIAGAQRAMLAAVQHPGTTPTGPNDTDGDGIPNDVEIAEGLNPSVKDNDIFGNSRLFAMQQYRDFLAREGDAGGIAYWSQQLGSGATTRAQMAMAFLISPEFADSIAPVARLYFAYFQRIPDYDGLNYWIAQYRTRTIESISDTFAASPEFSARYGAPDNAQFVALVYQNVLGRAPDATGRDYWAARLASGAMTRGQLMVAFSESSEYRSLITPEVLVTMTYMGMLRRAPDPGGFSYWVNYVDQGNSLLALVTAFVNAPEYRRRFLP